MAYERQSTATVRSLRVLAVAVLALATALAAAAQTNTGEVTGVVRDVSGAVLPGATIVARHVATGTVVERTTDADGRFFLPALRTGQWDLTATLAGFAPRIHKGLVVAIGQHVTLEFSLGIEGVSEQVLVSAAPRLLQTATAEISDVIENRQVV